VCGCCALTSQEANAMGDKLRRCGGCHGEWYCSRECQLKRWPIHKSTCASVRASRACPVCYDTPVADHKGRPTDDTVRCANGHGVCVECWRQLNPVRCPLCRGAYPVQQHAYRPAVTPRPRPPFFNELDELGMWLQLGHTYMDIVNETY
jgi:hypothetical protein